MSDDGSQSFYETCSNVQKESFDSTDIAEIDSTDLDGLPLLKRIKTMKQALGTENRHAYLTFQYGQDTRGKIEHHIFKDENNDYGFKYMGSYDSDVTTGKGQIKRVFQKMKDIFQEKTQEIVEVFKCVKQSWKTGTPITKENCKGCKQKEEPDIYLNRFVILMDLEVTRCLQNVQPLPVALGIACMLDCIIASDDPVSCFDKYFNNSKQEYHMFSGDRVRAIKNVFSEWCQINNVQGLQESHVKELLGVVTETSESEDAPGDRAPVNVVAESSVGAAVKVVAESSDGGDGAEVNVVAESSDGAAVKVVAESSDGGDGAEVNVVAESSDGGLEGAMEKMKKMKLQEDGRG